MIKSYIQYITELRNVTTDISKSGHTKTADIVYDDPSKAKSPSSGVLLKNDLRNQEFQDLIKNIKNVGVKKILQKHAGNPKAERMAVTLNNTQFLKDTQQECVDLRCEYCNKGPLRIYDITGNGPKFNPRDGATVDHKHPQSRGGDKYSYDNLAVCCYKCNQNKGNMSYEDWMYRIGKPVLESAKIEREDINNMIIDIRDDFPFVDFFGYGSNTFMLPRESGKYLRHNKYELSILCDKEGSNTNPIKWDSLRPYVEEFVDRVSELGLEIKKCNIFYEVDFNHVDYISSQDGPHHDKDAKWETILYKEIPVEIFGSTGRIGWITVDFEVKTSFIQRAKNKLKFFK